MGDCLDEKPNHRFAVNSKNLLNSNKDMEVERIEKWQHFREPDTLNLIRMRDGDKSPSDITTSLKTLSSLLEHIRKFYRVSFVSKNIS